MELIINHDDLFELTDIPLGDGETDVDGADYWARLAQFEPPESDQQAAEDDPFVQSWLQQNDIALSDHAATQFSI